MFKPLDAQLTSCVKFDVISDTLPCLHLHSPAIKQHAAELCLRRTQDKKTQIMSLLKAVQCIDLTSLCGDDTECNIQRLCNKAENPINVNILKNLDHVPNDFHVAAVCVYPSRINDCADALCNLGSNVPIAAVAAGFPSGQYPHESKLEEIKYCVEAGADEIDIVISRDLVLDGQWELLYEEVKAFKEACGECTMLKTIIAAGELGSYENIYKASIICMAAGSDYIKTSTGKEAVNATLPIGIVMAWAIRDYYEKTGFKVGFKPAGGIRTAQDILNWQTMIQTELGTDWLHPDLFRIGASGVLSDIERFLSQ